MTEPQPSDVWALGAAYEPYVGRWSRLVAREFSRWLDVSAHSRWLDVGCGTGALSRTILEHAAPSAVKGIDGSARFVQYAREQIADPRASFGVGDAQALPEPAASFDAAVSGLVLNFVPSPERMIAELVRVTRAGGTVAVYVWDYADQMQLMRYFWDAAIALDPASRSLDEGQRFPICQPEPLAELFRSTGLTVVETRAIDIPTTFVDFDDYWSPFTGGQGPAPSYLATLNQAARSALREHLRRQIPTQADGSIRLLARAWAARGKVPG